MMSQQLTLDQLEQLNQISDPAARRRYAALFQLPQDLQIAFESEATTNSVWSITKDKYHLADGDIGKVARVIGLIFLGELPIKNFIAELKNKLNVDVATAQAIAQDINQAIFQPVRESLMRMHGITSNANTQIHANDANKETTNYKPQITNKFQNPPLRQGFEGQANDKNPQPQTNNDYEARQRRDEVLNKIRPPQPPPLRPPSANDYEKARQGSMGQVTARPAGYYHIPRKNIVDLKKLKKKNRYNGFFT